MMVGNLGCQFRIILPQFLGDWWLESWYSFIYHLVHFKVKIFLLYHFLPNRRALFLSSNFALSLLDVTKLIILPLIVTYHCSISEPNRALPWPTLTGVGSIQSMWRQWPNSRPG